MSLDPRTSAPDLVTRSSASLPEVYKSIPIPAGAGFWRKLLAFAGPGYLVAVGYMDPGNWATDLAGGARYGYQLLCVIVISNFMAILLQALSARLGIASGRDLAQACRDRYSRPTTGPVGRRLSTGPAPQRVSPQRRCGSSTAADWNCRT